MEGLKSKIAMHFFGEATVKERLAFLANVKVNGCGGLVDVERVKTRLMRCAYERVVNARFMNEPPWDMQPVGTMYEDGLMCLQRPRTAEMVVLAHECFAYALGCKRDEKDVFLSVRQHYHLDACMQQYGGWLCLGEWARLVHQCFMAARQWNGRAFGRIWERLGWERKTADVLMLEVWLLLDDIDVVDWDSDDDDDSVPEVRGCEGTCDRVVRVLAEEWDLADAFYAFYYEHEGDCWECDRTVRHPVTGDAIALELVAARGNAKCAERYLGRRDHVWDRQAHAQLQYSTGPRERLREHQTPGGQVYTQGGDYVFTARCWKADRRLGTLLLGMNRLVEMGQIEEGHASMYEDMFEVPMHYLFE